MIPAGLYGMLAPYRLRNLAKCVPSLRGHVPSRLLLPWPNDLQQMLFTLPIMRAACAFSDHSRETSLSTALSSYYRSETACGNLTVTDFPLATSSNVFLNLAPSSRCTNLASVRIGLRRGLCDSASGGKLDEPKEVEFARLLREYKTLAEELKERCV